MQASSDDRDELNARRAGEGKPSLNEQEYFAQREAELIRELKEKYAREQLEQERAEHWMRCPKCGGQLTTTERDGVQVDTCGRCGGLWLDAGELEALLSHEDPGLLRRLATEIKRHVKGDRT
ncbi:MAG: zf-TFIIB domain-containing protein [Gemmatimonadota bacterium]